MAYPISPLVAVAYDWHEDVFGGQFRLVRPSDIKDERLIIDRERRLWGLRNGSAELKLVPFGEYAPQPEVPDRAAVVREVPFKPGERIILVVDQHDAKSLEPLKRWVEIGGHNAAIKLDRMIKDAKDRPSREEPPPKK